MKKKLMMFGLAVILGGILHAQGDELQVGQKAPEFSVVDTKGKEQSLGLYKGKFVVLEWTNYGCPFVKKHYEPGNMQALQENSTSKGVVWLSVCSSAKGKEGYLEPKVWEKEASKRGVKASALLPDPSGQVGKLYGAKTTPHLFVINPEGLLIYQGAIDDKPSTDQSDIQGARNHVKLALEEAMAGKPVSVASTSSYGCSVKYK